MNGQPASVDLWVTPTEWCDDPASLTRFEAMCDQEERARLARYTHPDARLNFLVARALCRSVLSRYGVFKPEQWSFVDNAYGRPSLAGSQAMGQLRFNLSHTFGRVVLAVSRGRDVGVDIEDLQRKSRTTQIAHRFFAPSEVEALKALPREAQRERFFTYWTLKEAYIKARGMGLAIPLAKFAFDVETPGHIQLRTAPELADPPERWRFVTGELDGRYPLSVALEVSREEVARLSLRVGCPGGQWRCTHFHPTAKSGAVDCVETLGVRLNSALTPESPKR